MMWNSYPFGCGLGILGALLWIGWWAFVVAAIVTFVRWIRSDRSRGPKGRSAALELLRERYAKSEIGKAEFDEKRKDLEEPSA